VEQAATLRGICHGWLWSGYVLPVLVGMSEFEQQVNIKYFFKLQKSAAGTLVGLNAVYGDKALKASGNWVTFLTYAFY
jgi:hypothetical protein